MIERAANAMTIWLIDHRSYRRNFCRLALEGAGFVVVATGQYIDPPMSNCSEARPDLVILGCTKVGAEERELVKRIVNLRYRLLVLPTTLPPEIMRLLFRAGAQDVTEMPDGGGRLVQLVREALERAAAATSYQELLAVSSV